MAWQEVEGTKPPLEYNEDEEKTVDETVLKSEEEELRKEIKGATLTREQGEELGSKLGSNVIFDSKLGYKK